MPIMLALCSMLLHTYYAKNYASIINSGLVIALYFAALYYIPHYVYRSTYIQYVPSLTGKILMNESFTKV